MADYFPAEIHIGGPIPRAALDDLIEAILAEGVSLHDYGGPGPTREELDEALREGAAVDLYDDQACYGQFEDLEAFLVNHGIHFDRHGDAHCEFNAENVHYRGSREPLIMLADQSGNSLVRCQEVLEILDGLAGDKTKLKAIRDLAAPPHATPLKPIQFIGGAPCPRTQV